MPARGCGFKRGTAWLNPAIRAMSSGWLDLGRPGALAGRTDGKNDGQEQRTGAKKGETRGKAASD
ncbi:hypothetical protein BEL01nite_33750 [Bradyrhizobium elkanii]|nr:hypothetical protein BEL01nite_33750 [Bradyrhizobium elkanii]